uniref:Uncharacterized protein n=1 Tax=Palpitomonas bilix TaxID=652834 RepID=A0A7S3D5B7_9EUKA|mmetsp:Transcript_22125/g.57084  ORF Transcript_22125/g.57084 Transcript_22125/m.57084 type:complete len:213 (+) Transcript_22125:49-687(+)
MDAKGMLDSLTSEVAKQEELLKERLERRKMKKERKRRVDTATREEKKNRMKEEIRLHAEKLKETVERENAPSLGVGLSRAAEVIPATGISMAFRNTAETLGEVPQENEIGISASPVNPEGTRIAVARMEKKLRKVMKNEIAAFKEEVVLENPGLEGLLNNLERRLLQKIFSRQRKKELSHDTGKGLGHGGVQSAKVNRVEVEVSSFDQVMKV